MGNGSKKWYQIVATKQKINSRSGSLLYLQVHFPFIIFWKIGIVSWAKGAGKRAAEIDRAVFGWPIPVMILWMPGAYQFEQFLHRRLSWLNVRFYKGDGASEWFLFVVAVPVFLLMWAIWFAYLFAIDIILGTHFFELVVGWILDTYYFLKKWLPIIVDCF